MNGEAIPSDPDYAAAVALKQMAEEDQSYDTRCIYGEKVFYKEDIKTRAPGHIATSDGMAEFNISTCCEYHFDLNFGTDEDELPDPRWAAEHPKSGGVE